MSIFGPHLIVYLDIFHAIQRISQKIPYPWPCLKALQLVFRDRSYQGPISTKPTPDLTTLHTNLLVFQQQCEGNAYNDRQNISPAAYKEISPTIVHTHKRCISGIPPGRSTNRNEQLHIRTSIPMTTTRYGVELAYALLTSIYYSHWKYYG